MVIQPLYSQSKDNGSINFEVDNEKLSSALYRLAIESNLNFSYDSADTLFNTKLSYNAADKQPLLILDDLLSNTTHTYKLIGNQIVIYRNKSRDSTLLADNEEVIEAQNKVDKPVVIIPRQDPIPVEPLTDTIFIQDTIVKIQTDTILITDTVFVEKEKPKKPPPTRIKDIPADYFNPSASRENGWSAKVSIAPIASDFSLARQTDEWTLRNFSFGVEVSKIINDWNISGGFKLTQFSEKFNHSYNVNEGGYYVTDTIDEYYTVIQNDTAWYYVTDSSWKPVDNHEYSYNINNRVGYLEFIASVSYDYYSDRKLRLYIVAGAQAGFLIYSTGLAIPDADEPAGVDFADLSFNTISYSILVGTGIKYRINEYFDFNTELYYFNNFNEVVIDYPVSKKIRGIGLKFGLIYYF